MMADVENEYVKNNLLRKEDVKALQEWAEKQSHFPPMSEFQVILFLQSCYFSMEQAKVTIENFFTVKAHCPELFDNRDPLSPQVQQAMSIYLYEPMSKKTPEGYKIIWCKIMDLDASNFVFSEQLKFFDMSVMLWLAQEGTAEGMLLMVDLDGLTLGHMARIGIMNMKKFFYYLQEAMPVRLKGMHFVNVISFMDKLLALMKPFMKKELLDTLYLHTDGIDSLLKHIPLDCLPKDYGGPLESAVVLHEKMKKRLEANKDFFKAEELQKADESKRVGKPKNAGDIFGVEGSFKKLDID